MAEMNEMLGGLLAYLPAVVTMCAGAFAFFWARDGERNKVGGIGWAALAFVVVAGLVAVVQTHVQRRSAAASALRAEELSEELRKAQFTTSAAMLTQIARVDVTQPVGDAGFYLEIPYLGDEPQRLAGFTGPFPTLRAGESGTLTLWLDDVLTRAFRLSPVGSNGLLLRDPDGAASDFRLEPEQPHKETDPEKQEWIYSPELAEPALEIDSGKAGGDTYALTMPAEGQYRRLITQLVKQIDYGQLVLDLKNADESRIEQIEEGLRKVAPTFVFMPETEPPCPADDGSATTYIRVPMEFRRTSEAGKSPAVFKLRSALRGFRTEVCQTF